MVKREKEALQAFVNQFSGFRDLSSEAFEELQEFCRVAGLPAWSSADLNYRQLMRRYADDIEMEIRITRAYNDYIRAEGKKDVISDLMSTLSKLNFWKS